MRSALNVPVTSSGGTLDAEVLPVASLTGEDWANWTAWRAADVRFVSPYFHPAFARIAARVSPGSGVAVFQRGGRPVGYYAFQRRGGALQPLAAPMSDYHGVITAPGESVTLEDAARLLHPARFSVSAWVGEADGGLERSSLMSTAPEGGYEVWYAERRKRFRKYFKDKERARRGLEADLGTVRVDFGLRDPALLDRLISLKRDQYRRTGRHDIFACGWTAELLRALMEEPEDGLGASICALWAGDQLTALEYSLHSEDQYHFWFPAYEPTLARCSPGILLSLETMRIAMPQGYRVFDYGFGGETYKKYFVDAERSVREAVVLRPGVTALAGDLAGGMLGLAGEARSQKIRTSVRRRWAAIEACETSSWGRFKGAVGAARAAAGKLRQAGPALAGDAT